MPLAGRILYDNLYSSAVGLAFLMGRLTGGLVKQGLEYTGWLSQSIQLGHIRLLYALSALGIVILQSIVLLNKRGKPCRERISV